MTEFTGEVHPLAAVWPLLPDDELDALAESIVQNGLVEPLVLDQKGRLVDGRNRLEACRRAGAEPRFVVATLLLDDTIAGFIAAKNADRRHLSAGQQAAGRALMLAEQGKRRNGRWARGTFANNQEFDRSQEVALSKAGFVLDWTPDLLPQVLAGSLALDAAYQQAKAAEDEAKSEERANELAAAQLVDLRDNRPDLADLVDTGSLPLDDALTIRDKERAEETRRLNGIAERRRKFSEGLSRSIHYLAPLALHPERREQLATDLEPAAMLLPITPADLTAAHQALDLIASELGAPE